MEELQTGIGTKEATTLKPLVVVIKEVKIEEVGTKKAKKVVFSCLHPESQDLIKISQVKYENKGKLEVTGTWYNLDADKLIKKNSSLAVLIQSNGANNISEMIGKSINTILDDKGYLAFKAY